MSEQSTAQSFVRQIGISEPQIAAMNSDRTLFVEGIPRGDKFEWSCDRGACFFVAVTVLRVAMENGMAKICINRGANHKHYFDVVEVLAAHKKNNGVLPNPRMKNNRPMPAMYATMGAKAGGGQFDTRRLIVPVQSRVKESAGAAA